MPGIAIGFVTLAFAPWLAAATQPAAAPDLVLNCYVMQSGDASLGQFVRHLEVRPEQEVVVIADGLRGAAPRYVGNGRLISLDAEKLVYDFASSRSAGRTLIDRRTGAFSYSDGRTVVRGSCQPSGQ